MFVTNHNNFGHLINNDDMDLTHKNHELYQLFNNPYDWEKRYLHPNYSHSLEEDAIIEQVLDEWYSFVNVY